MLKKARELDEAGCFCDWLDIKEAPPIKWRLTVVSIDKENEE